MKNSKVQVLAALLLLGFMSPNLAADNRSHVSKKYTLPSNRTTELNIDIDAAEVDIRPVDGDEVVIDAVFTRRDFDLHIDFDEDEPVLDIEFDKHSWNDDDDDESARIRIEIPRRFRVIVDAKIKAGEIDLDLGGLSLEELELTTWAGEVGLNFSDRNRVECVEADINTKVGETRINNLSNLRFKHIEIDGGIGEMRIDFGGMGQKDASAEIDLDIGETHVEVPDDLGIRLAVSKFLFLTEVNVSSRFEQSGNRYYSKHHDSADRSLDLEVSPGLGAFHIH